MADELTCELMVAGVAWRAVAVDGLPNNADGKPVIATCDPPSRTIRWDYNHQETAMIVQAIAQGVSLAWEYEVDQISRQVDLAHSLEEHRAAEGPNN